MLDFINYVPELEKYAQLRPNMIRNDPNFVTLITQKF